MAESLFDIFGDHRTRQVKNVTRQPLSNIENMGKKVTTGPVKPNEPLKKAGETKKSFLSNTGKALQNTPARNIFTPVRNVFTPRAVNIAPVIYRDSNDDENDFDASAFEFTKPANKYDNYHKDVLDFLPLPEVIVEEVSPPNTPPPTTKQQTMDFDSSYQDEFFKDDFSIGSIPEEDLGLPDIY